MNKLIADFTVKFIYWRSCVANNEDVITYIYDLIKDLDEDSMVENHQQLLLLLLQSSKKLKPLWRQTSVNCVLRLMP